MGVVLFVFSLVDYLLAVALALVASSSHKTTPASPAAVARVASVMRVGMTRAGLVMEFPARRDKEPALQRCQRK